MSSRAMPLATRLPRNGRREDGLSVATSGERAGNVSPRARASSAACLRSSLLRGPRSRPPMAVPKSGSSSPVRVSSTSRSMVRSPSKASLP